MKFLTILLAFTVIVQAQAQRQVTVDSFIVERTYSQIDSVSCGKYQRYVTVKYLQTIDSGCIVVPKAKECVYTTTTWTNLFDFTNCKDAPKGQYQLQLAYTKEDYQTVLQRPLFAKYGKKIKAVKTECGWKYMYGLFPDYCTAMQYLDKLKTDFPGAFISKKTQ